MAALAPVYVSSDAGASWTNTGALSGLVGTIGGACYGGGKFLVTQFYSTSGGTTNTNYASSDGFAWQAVTMPVASHWIGCGWFNNLFIVADWVGAVYTSPDLVNWTLRLNVGAEVDYICRGNGIVLLLDYGATTLRTSADGITWISRTFPNGGQAGFQPVYNGASYLAVSLNNGGAVLKSADGISWSSATSPNSGYKYVAACTGYFCITAEGDSNVYLSLDGVTWDAHPVPNGGLGWKVSAIGSSSFIIGSASSMAYYILNVDPITGSVFWTNLKGEYEA